MKLSSLIRNLSQRMQSALVRLCCLTLLVGAWCPGDALMAQQKSKGRAQLENERKAALKQISETEQMLKKTNQSATNQLRQLNILNAEIDTRKALIATMRKELQAMDSEMRALKATITDLQSSLDDKRERYAAAMRHSYKWRNGYEELLFIFSASDLQEAMRRSRYLQEYSAWRKRQAEEIREEKQKTEQAREALNERLKERKALLANVTAEQAELKKKQNKQQSLINELNKKKKQLNKELEQQRKMAKGLDRKIQNLIEEEAKKAMAEDRKKQGGKKPAGQKQEEMVSPEVQKLTGTFLQNKGKMAYPVNSPYALIGRFGKQKITKFVETDNGGIILQTKKGAEACAVFDGEVKAVSAMPGYNTIVLVGHGQYFTVYANLSKVYVTKGTKVKARDPLGLIYTDEADGLTKMEFQIRKGTVKLDPETWLKK